MATAAYAPLSDRPIGPRGISPQPHTPGVRDDADADAYLIAAAARGDAAALDQLYHRYRAAAFATAYALLREPCAAEDAVHDAFINVWRGAGSFRPSRGAFRGWLLTIVRNAARDQLRTRYVAGRHQPILHWSTADLDQACDVPATVAAAADAHRLRAALATLPSEQRQALELSFMAGLTHREIAARTGLPLGTVKGRLRLGLRRLRHELRDLAPEPPHGAHPGLRAA